MNDLRDAVPRQETIRPSRDATGGAGLPRTVPALIWESGARHQVALLVLTVIVFLLDLVPLELQRRIVNDLVDKRDLRLLVLLCAAYAALVLGYGAVKL